MHACNKGQYPYPDENVFLVSGIPVGADPYDPTNTAAMVIVARRPEVATEYFVDIASFDVKINGCVSLAQLQEVARTMQLAASDKKTVDVSKGKPSDGYGLRQPWLVGKNIFVIASSSDDVFTYAKVNELHPGGVMSEEVIKATIKPMISAKLGLSENDTYATDFEAGELEEQAAAKLAAMTPEQRLKREEFMELVAKKKSAGVAR